jgi:hypothetical protein
VEIYKEIKYHMVDKKPIDYQEHHNFRKVIIYNLSKVK